MRSIRVVKIAFLAGLLAVNGAWSVAGQDKIQIKGIRAEVSVVRDDRSIPYISAGNDGDLYFVQGWATASDRLWQMDLMRRLARGRTAEIFGRVSIEQDRRWRRLGFAKVAEDSIQHLSPEVLSALTSYAAGVNAYMATLTDETLPDECKLLRYRPEPWQISDSLVIGKILADALSSTYQRDLQRESLIGFDEVRLQDLMNGVTPYDVVLFGSDKKAKAVNLSPYRRSSTRSGDSIVGMAEVPEVDAIVRERGLSMVGFGTEELAASNNWVVSGKRTADGKPILANDPHLAPSAPGIWYLVHLSTPSMRVAGVTFPGTPGVVLGHNEHIAWGATNVGPDVQDLYRLAFSEGKYATATGLKTPAIRKEEIKFRPNPLDPKTEFEVLNVTESDLGPVILEREGTAYALRWTALDPKNNEIEAFLFLNRSKNWEDFRGSLQRYRGATQNFVYADVKGNIGWQVAGAIPIRRAGDGALPYDPAKTDGDWIGMIPFDELPRLYNPKEGFIITANQRIVGTDYKYPQMSRDTAMPWRARRLHDLISKDAKITRDATEAAQFDVFNIPLKMFAEDLIKLKVLDESTSDSLSKWDGKMTATSTTATYVNEVRNCFGETIASAYKPAPAAAVRERILFWAVRENSARWLPSTFKSYGDLAKYCDTQSVEKLTKKYGSDRATWNWGKEAVSAFPHPLAAIPLIGSRFATPRVNLAGSGQTPNVASFVSMRHVTSPGVWDDTRFVIPLGQSGVPGSKHYSDQFEAWRTGKAPVFPFSADAVKKAARSAVIYSPN
jgi:penicillin G amidase